jgi:hypothetical protein
MSAVPEDFHDLANLVGTARPLQLLLPTAGPKHRIRQLGTVDPALQRSRPIAGSLHATTVGLPPAGQSLVLDKTELGAILSPILFTAPTILAWDCAAAGRILRLEANSP